MTYDVMIKLDRPDDRNWIGQRGEILDSFWLTVLLRTMYLWR